MKSPGNEKDKMELLELQLERE
jgi:hypothetical protein